MAQVNRRSKNSGALLLHATINKCIKNDSDSVEVRDGSRLPLIKHSLGPLEELTYCRSVLCSGSIPMPSSTYTIIRCNWTGLDWTLDPEPEPDRSIGTETHCPNASQIYSFYAIIYNLYFAKPSEVECAANLAKHKWGHLGPANGWLAGPAPADLRMLDPLEMHTYRAKQGSTSPFFIINILRVRSYIFDSVLFYFYFIFSVVVAARRADFSCFFFSFLFFFWWSDNGFFPPYLCILPPSYFAPMKCSYYLIWSLITNK